MGIINLLGAGEQLFPCLGKRGGVKVLDRKATVMATKKTESQIEVAPETNDEKPECFVLMPIGEREEYGPDHFKRVYEDIFVPACDKAGFKAVRADDVKKTNFIVLDIIKQLIDAPMALCDLSTRNPNVLFELGIRQAFDKPVVLVQEEGTPQIFDITTLRYEQYRRARLYHEVQADQERITVALRETFEDSQSANPSINSLVKLLSLTQAANIPSSNTSPSDAQFQLIQTRLDALSQEVRGLKKGFAMPPNLPKVSPNQDSKINETVAFASHMVNILAELNLAKIAAAEDVIKRVNDLIHTIEALMETKQTLSLEQQVQLASTHNLLQLEKLRNEMLEHN
jgi:hypothetical protein